jgi:hypothetical protein
VQTFNPGEHKLKVLRIRQPELRDMEIITALGTRRGTQQSGMRYLLGRDPAPEVRSFNGL